MTNKILCQLDIKGRGAKPSSLSEYGRIRDRVIQKHWDYIPEEEFVHKVCTLGYPFYGCLFKGRDLMEIQSQRGCWLTQTLVGLDFDHSPSSPEEIVEIFRNRSLPPWLGYRTFSDTGNESENSFRLLWKVEVDLRLSYDKVFSRIKVLSRVPHKGLVDARSRDPGRLWQGSDKGHFLFSPTSSKLDLSDDDLFSSTI